MHFGNLWLLACVCFVLGGCSVATLPTAHTSASAPVNVLTKVRAEPNANVSDDGSRLGPPSPRGLGERRIDRAVSANTPLARY